MDALSPNFPPENRDCITIFDVKDYVLSLSSNEQLIIIIRGMCITEAYSGNAIYQCSK